MAIERYDGVYEAVERMARAWVKWETYMHGGTSGTIRQSEIDSFAESLSHLFKALVKDELAKLPPPSSSAIPGRVTSKRKPAATSIDAARTRKSRR